MRRFLGAVPGSVRGVGALIVGLLLASPAAAVSTLVLLGDSITDGTGGSVSEPTGPSYAEIVTAELAGTHAVTNIGAPGTSAFYWSPANACPGICSPGNDTLFEELASPVLPADIVTVLLGTNDAAGAFLPERTPSGDYEVYIRDILDALFAEGAGHVILLAPPQAASLATAAQDLLAEYADATRVICQDTLGVICGPNLHTLLDPATDFASGDVHPNRFGHQKIADALLETVLAIPEPGTGLLIAAGLGLAAGCGARGFRSQ